MPAKLIQKGHLRHPEVQPSEPCVLGTARPVDLDTPPTKRNGQPGRKRELQKQIDEARTRATKMDFVGADHRILVGLYAWLHETVYGVAATSLQQGREYGGACSSAARFARDLGGVAVAAMAVRWTWARERHRLAQNPDRDFRIGWRFQFGKTLIDDYRVAKRREHARSR